MDRVFPTIFATLSLSISVFASPIKSCISARELIGTDDIDESQVEYIEFNGTQYIALDDIHPNYYTYRYVALEYQLTAIIRGYVQMLGTPSMGVTICSGSGFVQSQSIGIKADLDRHLLTMDGVVSPYHCEYDGQNILNFTRSGNSAWDFFVGAVAQSSQVKMFCYMKFYGMTIATSSTATPQNIFVPWRIGEEGCVKDLVTGKVYLPSMPVAFGPDVN